MSFSLPFDLHVPPPRTAMMAAAGAIVAAAMLRRLCRARSAPSVASSVEAQRVAEAVSASAASWPDGAAFVDEEAFVANVDAMIDAVASGDQPKRVRVATKSVRSVDLLRAMIDRCQAFDSRRPSGCNGDGASFAGLMCFTAEEAVMVARHPRLGPVAKHILVAYPITSAATAAKLARWHVERHARPGEATTVPAVACVVDCVSHVRWIAEAVQAIAERQGDRTPPAFPIWIDVDMSMRVASLHLGVRRSPIRTLSDAAALLAVVSELRSFVAVEGVMGYEAQIAGLPDTPDIMPRGIRDTGVTAWGRSLFKKASIRECHQRRGLFARELAALLPGSILVNGGGSGSLSSTCADPSVTEVTIGSGALCGHLFSRYSNSGVAGHYRPALHFALRVSRIPAPGVVTCLGGGWVASGASGEDRLPLPVFPAGATLLSVEGAGEVQTPVALPPSSALHIGDPVVFRPSKSGELAEIVSHYNVLHHATGPGLLPDTVLTYRGEGIHAWS